MSDETLNDPTNVSVAVSTLAPGTTAGEVPTWTGAAWSTDVLSDYPVNIISNTATALTVKATSGGNTVFGVDAKNALVDIKGDLTVYGNTTLIDTENLSVSNSMIKLANGNPADLLDIGIYGKYINGVGSLTHYAAFYRDASDSGKWKLETTDTEPNLTVTGGTSASLSIATLNSSALTASRLVASDASKNLASVTNLASWIAGTSNQVTVTDDGDGTLTLSTPQSIGTSSTVQFGVLGVGEAPTVALHVASSSVNATDIRLKNTSVGGNSWALSSLGSTYTGNLLGSLNLYNETGGVTRMNIGLNGNMIVGSPPTANGALNRLDVAGALCVGADAAGATTAPTNGLYLQGNLELKASGTGTIVLAASGTTTSHTMILPSSIGTDGQYLTTNGSGQSTWKSYGTQVYVHRLAAHTSGGASTANTWVTRTLNLAESGNLDGVFTSLASNIVTIQPGNYLLRASGPAFIGSTHLIRIYNTTAGATLIEGTSEYSGTSSAASQTRSFAEAYISIVSATGYRIDHQTNQTQSPNGLGAATAGAMSNAYNVYTVFNITKLA